jgi:hypothetical protein
MEQNENYSPVESPGDYYPQDYYIKTLNLLTSNGQTIELKKLLLDMSYYEDIYTFAASGHITIIDAQGFIELLQLTGNEFIEVNFGKVKDAPNENIQKFRVYKTGNRKPSGNNNSEPYTLYFCSEELMLSEQIKISKSYTGKKISEIVKDILVEKLKIKSKNIQTIEETTGMYDFVIPKMKPFEAISWVSTYARPQTYGSTADMLFFETKNGFNFRSIQSMNKEDVYASYRYEPKNISYDNQNFQDKTTQVLEYEFNKVYDMMHDINSGAFANRLVSIDPMTRSFNVTDFDYTKSKMEKLNPEGVLNDLQNRLGTNISQAFEGVLKVATGNSNQGNIPYIKEKQGGFAKDISIETFLPLRTAAIALANYTSIKLSIPGDPGITAGRTINFDLYSLKPTDNLKELDKFYSGKYLVTAVRHIIQPTRYQTILEIAKDSSKTAYTQTDNNSPTTKEAVSA